MKLAQLFEHASLPSRLYHVTMSDKLDSIKSKGLLRMQTSNWVMAASGERYGNGEVFAFEHIQDAIRWAAKMDYTFNKTFGSGKVSIVEFEPAKDSVWEEDEADPLGQAGSKGRWLKSLQMVTPDRITNVFPLTKEMVKSLASG